MTDRGPLFSSEQRAARSLDIAKDAPSRRMGRRAALAILLAACVFAGLPLASLLDAVMMDMILGFYDHTWNESLGAVMTADRTRRAEVGFAERFLLTGSQALAFLIAEAMVIGVVAALLPPLRPKTRPPWRWNRK